MRNAKLSKTTAPKPPSFASLVEQFFTQYLVAQRAVSPRTVACYRDALMLFLDFADRKLGKMPTAIRLADIQPELILAFLDHLEHGRNNAVRSRNLRLTALRSFLKFAGRRDVASLHVVERALAVPMKRFERPMLGFLSREEMVAVLGQPGLNWSSQRDHLLLVMLYNTGARVSEIIGVRVVDVVLNGAACVHLHGKGRKQRSVPLWKSTVIELRAWLRLNPTLRGETALLPNRDGQAMSRFNVTQRLDLAVARAAAEHPQKADLPTHAATHHGHAPASIGRPVQRDRAVARPREHDHYASLRRGRPRDEGESARPIGGARHQVASIQGAGLAHAILADPVTMCRLHRPRALVAIRSDAVCTAARAHSCDLHIGVDRVSSDFR
jgi:site-specific recombinase XerD